MDKDKQLAIPGESKPLERMNVHLGLIDKILNEDDFLTIPFTLEWWKALSDSWKKHIFFHISPDYNSYRQEKYLNPYFKWYEKKYGLQIKSTLKITEAQLFKVSMLNTLFLPQCSISDVTPLKAFKNIQSLELRFNEIENVKAIANFEKLSYLNLSGNHEFDNLEPLAKLINLQELHLFMCDISDLTPLSGLISLKILNLSQSGTIKDLSPLRNLNELKELELGMNDVKNIEPICQLRALRKLALWAMPIENFQPLSKLPKIEDLNLQDTGVKDKDLAFFVGLKTLKHLNLVLNPISNEAVDNFLRQRPDVSVVFDKDVDGYDID